MPTTTPHPLRRLIESGAHEGLADLLHPDVQFRSPAVHRPYEGRTACLHLLGHVSQVFEDFRYIDELTTGNRTGLVFRASVGEKALEGWDYLVHDDDGLITEFTVMVRPLSGLIALAQAMGQRLESDPVPRD